MSLAHKVKYLSSHWEEYDNEKCYLKKKNMSNFDELLAGSIKQKHIEAHLFHELSYSYNN